MWFTLLQLLEELTAAGLQPNGKTHELLVDSAVVAADVPRMLAALQVTCCLKTCWKQLLGAMWSRCCNHRPRMYPVQAAIAPSSSSWLLLFEHHGSLDVERRTERSGDNTGPGRSEGMPLWLVGACLSDVPNTACWVCTRTHAAGQKMGRQTISRLQN